MIHERPKEIVATKLATKTVYRYQDLKNGIDLKSKEVFKRENLIVHYPFIARTDRQKYNQIERTAYKGTGEPLPVGFRKAPTRGCGFMRELAPILNAVQDEFPVVRQMTVSKTRASQRVSRTEVVFNLTDRNQARLHRVGRLRKFKREEVEEWVRAGGAGADTGGTSEASGG